MSPNQGLEITYGPLNSEISSNNNFTDCTRLRYVNKPAAHQCQAADILLSEICPPWHRYALAMFQTICKQIYMYVI